MTETRTGERTEQTCRRRKARILAAAVIVLILLAAGLIGWRIWKKTHNYWAVTQHASTGNSQSMFYTIEDRLGGLVIVDGGYAWDADQVMNVIRGHKGRVDAWFLTHPDEDHAGAFLEIMRQEPDAVRIGRVYTCEVNREAFEAKARAYEDLDFQAAVQWALDGLGETVTYLHEDDEADVTGLHVKILHAWDACTDSMEKNLSNNGSLVFQVYGKEQNMLFCGDILKAMEPCFVPQHEDEFRADYVQCAHHGNNGLTTAFYELVDPDVAFMDGPEWLIDDTSGKYDSPELKAWFLERGTQVLYFNTAPNTIVLK